MNLQDAEEYTQSLGQIGSGWWRQIALGQRLGVPAALGLSTDEWVTSRLGGYIRLSIPERREAAKELTAPVDDGGQGMSQRQAAAVLGVHQSTLNRDRRGDAFAPSVGDDDVPDENGTDANAPLGGPVCEDCGTPTLPLWVNPEDEAFGVLLCGRCVERRDAATERPTPEPSVVDPAVEFFREKEDEKSARLNELSTQALHVWKTLLELSACREIPLEDVIDGLPVDRLEHVEPVANVLIAWLSELTNGTRDRQSQQPVGLASERIKRGRENGWRSPA